MARLKVPSGTTAVGHGTAQFVADDAGIIDTGDADATVVAHLLKFAGCREATDDDVEAADLVTAGAAIADEVKTEKQRLVEQLAGMGVAVDGRATLKSLRKQLEAKQAADADAKAAPDAAKKA